LQQGVTVDSRESFLKNLKDSPCLKRYLEAKDQPFMESTAQQELLKVKGCQKLKF
jgi:hypothetical protein